VGVPSFTFVASVDAVVWAGFTPVFLDVDPEDWHVSTASMARLADLGADLAGVLQCSTFGAAPSAARRRGLGEVAADLGVPVVVDSAAGFGSEDEDGRRLGDQGTAEVFSFHATKPFAIGEGGLVTSSSADVLQSVAQLSNFGFDRERAVRGPVGINAKMPELSAAVGLAVLATFDDVLAHRRAAAAWLRDELSASDVAFQQGSATSTHQFVPIALSTPEARDRLLAAAGPAGIELRVYFEPPMHRLAPFANLPRVDELDATEHLSRRIVGLPMANDIGSGSLERIRDLVRSTTRSRTRPWARRAHATLDPVPSARVATVA
jgi:dTDP-4-amino-4,6-dideoxygalactose transaminase